MKYILSSTILQLERPSGKNHMIFFGITTSIENENEKT